MEYDFLNSSIERENLILPSSDKINQFLLKNNREEIIKAIDFFATNEKFLYVYGFLGAGKRQILSYVQEFLNDDAILLEYFCKEGTVCDDILLDFTKYVSVGSIIALIISPFLMYFFWAPTAYVAYCALGAIYIVYLHRENIQRLIKGNENKVR